MVDANVKIIEELKLFLKTVTEEDDIRQLFTQKPSDFSRDRTMPLNKLATMMVNLPKRSLCVELQDFFNIAGSYGSGYSKSAYSQHRVKLKPIFFSLWNQCLLDSFYSHYGSSVKRWNGYRLIAVDGSTAYLFDKGGIKEHFGSQDNQHGQVPMARIIQAQDILNDLTLWGGIYPFRHGEQHLMATNIHHLPVDGLTIFDRGYPGYALMYLLLNQEQPRQFVMRCKPDFNNVVKEFVNSGKHSLITEFTPNKEACDKLYQYGYNVTKTTAIKIRIVKVRLSTGEWEILVTSLYDQEMYTLHQLKELYALRWGIETTYGKQKNQQQMEIFTGHRVICIEQDYAAGLFAANLQSLISKQTEAYTRKISEQRKYEYKINRNVSWAALKGKIIKLFLEQDAHTILTEIETAFKRNIEPVRRGREYARKRKVNRLHGKYQTHTNYRRSI